MRVRMLVCVATAAGCLAVESEPAAASASLVVETHSGASCLSTGEVSPALKKMWAMRTAPRGAWS
jgi:hypothetical protein